MVSIIIPVYKVEEYLKRCVDSVLSQSYRDIQVILVDDGSPDGCGAICDDYARRDSRIVSLHKENGGVSSARNYGLQYATGKYVTFCDCDDFYSPGWIAALVEAMERESADMVCADFTFYHEDASMNSIFRGEKGTYELADQQQRVQYCIEKMFGGKHSWNVWSRLFRRSLIQENSLQFCETCGNFAEDLCFILEYCLYCTRIVTIREAGYMYFQRPGSMMGTSAGKPKLDSVNEVSLYFEQNSRKVLAPDYANQILPIFHFCFLFNQYQVMMLTESAQEAADRIRAIRRYEAWEERTRAIFACQDTLEILFGKRHAAGILLLSEACLTGAWDVPIRRFRRYAGWKERRIWLKEAFGRVFGG